MPRRSGRLGSTAYPEETSRTCAAACRVECEITDNGPASALHSSRMNKTAYGFPAEKKEPISDAVHMRNAVARFNQVEGVTDTQRDNAWKRIKTTAQKFGVELNEEDWRDLANGGKR